MSNESNPPRSGVQEFNDFLKHDYKLGTGTDPAGNIAKIYKKLAQGDAILPGGSTGPLPSGAAPSGNITPSASQIRPPEQINGIGAAIAFMQNRAKATGKLPTVEEVSAVAGMSRTSLYRDPTFLPARTAIKQTLAMLIRRGSKDKDGRLEAEDD